MCLLSEQSWFPRTLLLHLYNEIMRMTSSSLHSDTENLNESKSSSSSSKKKFCFVVFLFAQITSKLWKKCLCNTSSPYKLKNIQRHYHKFPSNWVKITGEKLPVFLFQEKIKWVLIIIWILLYFNVVKTFTNKK